MRLFLAGNNKGFSLIELVVVIMIIAILSGSAMAHYVKFVEKSRQQEAISNMDNIRKSEAIYFLENGEYFDIVAGDPKSSDQFWNYEAEAMIEPPRYKITARRRNFNPPYTITYTYDPSDYSGEFVIKDSP